MVALGELSDLWFKGLKQTNRIKRLKEKNVSVTVTTKTKPRRVKWLNRIGANKHNKQEGMCCITWGYYSKTQCKIPEGLQPMA